MGRRRKLSTARLAVKEAHDAFDHGDIGSFSAVGEEWGDQPRPREKRVEVTARTARGEGVVGRVYKIRTHLEGRHPEAPVRKRGHQA